MVSTTVKSTTHSAPLDGQPDSQPSARQKTRAQAREIAQQMSHECVARRLRQVNRTVTRLYDEALRPHGLTVNQLNILAVIISEKQIRPGQLGQALGMEKSTVSRTIDRMVGKGWLKVAPGKDSRTQLLTVTTKGNQLLLAVTPVWDTLQAGILTTGDNNILNMLTVGDGDENDMSENGGQGDGNTKAETYTPITKYEPAYVDEPVSADDFYM